MEKEAAVNRASFSVGEKGVPMQLQKLLSLVRQAVDRYNMIAEGDKIAVGVSGGKDSLTLLYALKKLSQFYPKHFTVCAICVDLGYDNTDFTGIDEFCRNLDVPLTLSGRRAIPVPYARSFERVRWWTRLSGLAAPGLPMRITKMILWKPCLCP